MINEWKLLCHFNNTSQMKNKFWGFIPLYYMRGYTLYIVNDFK